MTPLATLTSPSRHMSCPRGGGEARPQFPCALVRDVPVGAVGQSGCTRPHRIDAQQFPPWHASFGCAH